MHKIYKYELNIVDGSISLPIGSKIIDFAESNSKLCLWAIVNTKEDRIKEYRYIIISTGFEEVPDRLIFTYFKTAHMTNGLVWHLFYA